MWGSVSITYRLKGFTCTTHAISTFGLVLGVGFFRYPALVSFLFGHSSYSFAGLLKAQWQRNLRSLWFIIFKQWAILAQILGDLPKKYGPSFNFYSCNWDQMGHKASPDAPTGPNKNISLILSDGSFFFVFFWRSKLFAVNNGRRPGHVIN